MRRSPTALLLALAVTAPSAPAAVSCGAGATLLDAARGRAALVAVVRTADDCSRAGACPVVVERVLAGGERLAGSDRLVVDDARDLGPIGQRALLMASRTELRAGTVVAWTDGAPSPRLAGPSGAGDELVSLFAVALADPPAPKQALLTAALDALTAGGHATDSATALLRDRGLRSALPVDAGPRLLAAATGSLVPEWERSCLVLLLADLRPDGWPGVLVEAIVGGAPVSKAADEALAGADPVLFEDDLLHAFGRAPREARPGLLSLVGALGAVDLLPEVHDLMASSDPATRLAAVGAVRRLADARSRRVLVPLRQHDDPATAAAARAALQAIDTSGAGSSSRVP